MKKITKRTLVFFMAFAIAFTVLPAMNGDLLVNAATKKPAKVTGLTVKKATATKVKVSWKKAKNAKKYQVYRKLAGGSYKLLKSTTAKTYSFTQTQGKKFYYKVRGINGSKKGNFSAVKSITLPIPKSIKASTSNLTFTSNTTKKVVFTCTKVDEVAYTYPENVVELKSESFDNGKLTLEFAPLKAGKGSITVRDKNDNKINCKVSIQVNRSIVIDKTTLTFSKWEDEEIVIDAFMVDSITYTYSEKAMKITDSGYENGHIKLTISPIKRQADESIDIMVDGELYKRIPVKNDLPIKVTMKSTFPLYNYNYSDCALISSCEVNSVVRSGKYNDIYFDLKGTSIKQSGAYLDVHFSVYDDEGYSLASQSIHISCEKGSSWKVTDYIFGVPDSDSYVIKITDYNRR